MKKVKLLAVLLTGLMAVSYGDDSGDYERYDIPFKGEKKLIVDLDFAFGSLNIRPSDNNEYIMRAGMSYFRDALKPSIVYEISGSKGQLELGTKNNNHDYSLKEFNKMKKDANENDWRLEFIKNVPTVYSIEFGAGDGNFDFSGMMIENMDFELAMGDIELYFNEPNRSRMKNMNVETGLGSFEARGLGNANISNFSLECGLGSSYLVFDGDFKGSVRAEVSVGLGSVDIEIPRNVAVEIRSESSFLSSVDFDDFEQIEKGLYQSANWRTDTSGRIIIEIAVGMGSASVEWIR
ncbi:MAG: toast rack family protein [Fidelibacterota bacterium]